MLFWYIFSGINNEYAPGKACWALQESQGNRAVRETQGERDGESEQTEKLKNSWKSGTQQRKERE